MKHSYLIVLAFIASVNAKEIPSRLILGLDTGKMTSCWLEAPDACLTLNLAGNPIKSMDVAGGFIYAGLESGIMWKCPLDTPHSCIVLNNGDSSLNGIAVTNKFIYGALSSGKLWRCDLERVHSCWIFNDIHLAIEAMAASDDFVYLGLGNGEMRACYFDRSDACWVLNTAPTSIKSLTIFGKYIYAGLQSGIMWRCDLIKKDSCEEFNRANKPIISISVHEGYIYAGLEGNMLWQCKLETKDSCTVVTIYQNKVTSLIAIYRAKELNTFYKDENVECTWQDRNKCAPYVVYFDLKQRSGLEIYVKNGKLYNNQDDLFDTKEADISHTGNKAIFVMDPKGKIYASDVHPTYLIHDSSFLSGKPVSAAGEMEVVKGVIRSITNCSGHYRPSVNLTEQVISSLLSKGYEGNLTIFDCSDVNLTIDSNYNQNNLQ